MSDYLVDPEAAFPPGVDGKDPAKLVHGGAVWTPTATGIERFIALFIDNDQWCLICDPATCTAMATDMTGSGSVGGLIKTKAQMLESLKGWTYRGHTRVLHDQGRYP